MAEPTCQHAACSDPGTETVVMEDGSEWNLCEDHKHMNPDGTPAGDYTPNDPDKFNDP